MKAEVIGGERYRNVNGTVDDERRTLYYPASLGKIQCNHPSVLAISCIDRKHSHISGAKISSIVRKFRAERAIENTKWNIFMYKPGNLVDTINNQYSNDTQSIVADVLVDMVNGSTGIIDGAKKIGNRVIQKSITDNTGVKQQVQEITLDPIITQFKGTQCRTITFEWDLRPSNLAELKLCAEIVNRFKTYSLPSVSVSELEKDTGVGTTVLKTPHYFKINEVQIKKNTPKYYSMFSMAPCVITSVSVSASDEPMGASNTISGTGGDPVWNKLRVTFQELIPLTMEDQRLINERRNITTKGFPIPEPTGIESGNTSDDEKDKAYRDLIEDLRQKNKKSRELEHENTSTEINK